MSIDKVQLKQEEQVGSDVVLTDINPITNTESIIDNANGMTMDGTLNAIWRAINAKLSRIVNSVNGRTGVVILDSSDVGLGRVDNVSFEDIKEWVLEQLKGLFDGKHLRIYNSMDEVQAVIVTNDSSYDNVMFYAKTGHVDDNDHLSYIGYFKYDETEQALGMEYKEINVVGFTDNSLIYNESINNVDMRSGGLAVNIHRDEDALYVENGPSKAESGLMIDKSKIAGEFIFADSLYTNPDGILARYSSASSGDAVTIYIDDVEIESTIGFFINKNSAYKLKTNDVIFTNFKYEEDASGLIDPLMMARQPALGYVTSAPSRKDPDAPYVIKFASIKPYSTQAFGIKLLNTHRNSAYTDSMLSLDLGQDFGETQYGNLSGLQALSTQPNPADPTIESHTHPFVTRILPWVSHNSYDGVSIMTDAGIAVYPQYETFPNEDTGYYTIERDGVIEKHAYGSDAVVNWCGYLASTNYYDGDPLLQDIIGDRVKFSDVGGYASSNASLSLNMEKIVRVVNQTEGLTPNKFKMLNVSGLRMNSSPDGIVSITPNYHTLDEDTRLAKMLGIYDGKDAVGNEVSVPKYNWTGGGVQINVGKFLEICPMDTVKAIDYYNGGKVQVRIGNGLKEDKSLINVTTSIDEEFWEKHWKECKMSPDGETFFDIPLAMTELEEEPTDWKYGFVNYYQKAIKGYLNNNILYEEDTFETVIPVNSLYDVYYDLITKQTYIYNDAKHVYERPFFLSRKAFKPSTSTSDYYVQVYNINGNSVPKVNNFFTNSGLTYYSGTPWDYTQIIDTIGYAIYQEVSTNRITIDAGNGLIVNDESKKIEVNIDPNSGLYINDDGQLSYTTPEYVEGGVSYKVGTIIRHYNELYYAFRDFTSTTWSDNYGGPNMSVYKIASASNE